jgi:hypothetical protein
VGTYEIDAETESPTKVARSDGCVREDAAFAADPAASATNATDARAPTRIRAR